MKKKSIDSVVERWSKRAFDGHKASHIVVVEGILDSFLPVKNAKLDDECCNILSRYVAMTAHQDFQ